MQSINVNAPRREDSFAADGMKGQQAALGQDFAAIFASFADFKSSSSSSLSALLSSLNPQDLIKAAPRPRTEVKQSTVQESEGNKTNVPAFLEPEPVEREPQEEHQAVTTDTSAPAEPEERSEVKAQAGAESIKPFKSSEILTLNELSEQSQESVALGRSMAELLVTADEGETDSISQNPAQMQDRQEQNLRLFTALQSQTAEPQKQQAAAQMMQVSDDKVQLDLKALSEGLKQPQPVKEQGDEQLQNLMSKANVLNVEVKNTTLDEVVKGGRENATELSTIAESLKLSSGLKSEGSALFGGETGSSQGQSQTPWFMQKLMTPQTQVQNPELTPQAQMGQALETLQKQAGTLPEGELGEVKLNIGSATEGGKTAGVQQSQPQEGLSFGQQVTAELNSAQRTLKSAQSKTNLADRLSKNAEELAKQVMAMAARNLQSVELNLNPGELGKLKISIDLTGAEEITKITVAASNPATRSLVGESLPKLREILLGQGMEVQTELDEGFSFSQEQQSAAQDGEQHLAEGQQQDNAEGQGLMAAQVTDQSEEKSEDLAQSSQNEHTLNFFA